ncbi:MAG: hypothetical protein M1812_004260 [Candelaria pacifica]|nr:MAG: hypothetical protein M1812_004260 [Candelaria pacifica]
MYCGHRYGGGHGGGYGGHRGYGAGYDQHQPATYGDFSDSDLKFNSEDEISGRGMLHEGIDRLPPGRLPSGPLGGAPIKDRTSILSSRDPGMPLELARYYAEMTRVLGRGDHEFRNGRIDHDQFRARVSGVPFPETNTDRLPAAVHVRIEHNNAMLDEYLSHTLGMEIPGIGTRSNVHGNRPSGGPDEHGMGGRASMSGMPNTSVGRGGGLPNDPQSAGNNQSTQPNQAGRVADTGFGLGHELNSQRPGRRGSRVLPPPLLRG